MFSHENVVRHTRHCVKTTVKYVCIIYKLPAILPYFVLLLIFTYSGSLQDTSCHCSGFDYCIIEVSICDNNNRI